MPTLEMNPNAESELSELGTSAPATSGTAGSFMLNRRYSQLAPVKAERDGPVLFDQLNRHEPGYFRKAGE